MTLFVHEKVRIRRNIRQWYWSRYHHHCLYLYSTVHQSHLSITCTNPCTTITLSNSHHIAGSNQSMKNGFVIAQRIHQNNDWVTEHQHVNTNKKGKENCRWKVYCTESIITKLVKCTTFEYNSKLHQDQIWSTHINASLELTRYTMQTFYIIESTFCELVL